MIHCFLVYYFKLRYIVSYDYVLSCEQTVLKRLFLKCIVNNICFLFCLPHEIMKSKQVEKNQVKAVTSRTRGHKTVCGSVELLVLRSFYEHSASKMFLHLLASQPNKVATSTQLNSGGHRGKCKLGLPASLFARLS